MSRLFLSRNSGWKRPGQVLRTQLPPAVRHAGETEADRRRAEQGVALTDAELGGGAMRALSPGAVINPRLQQQEQSSRTRSVGSTYLV
jgi:hypothetical protein